MVMPTPENFSRKDLVSLQEKRFVNLMRILPQSRFYRDKFAGVGLNPAGIASLQSLGDLPFTTKSEIIREMELHPPYGQFLTEDLSHYCRQHQTSGTSGRPLRWPDTAQSWTSLLETWNAFFRMIGLTPSDRLFFPFSFGPFLGFWTAFEAASRMGCLVFPAGGMSTSARLKYLLENSPTFVFCTPTYALRMIDVARNEGIDLSRSGVKGIVVAGEPGGSIPATRSRIETGWQARVYDHCGMTETGPLAMECPQNPGILHPLESNFIIEVLDPESANPVPPGNEGELVLTTLHRLGSPLVRYRTGDLVTLGEKPCSCGRSLASFVGGIRGRTDDMVVIRGNNFHPNALKGVLYRFSELADYRVEIDRTGTLPVLRVDIEPQTEEMGKDLAEKIGKAIHDQFLFKAEVNLVPPQSLPRNDNVMKSKRFIQKNNQGSTSRP